MTAIVSRLGSVVDAVDMFCGFGGTSQGIVDAGAELRLGVNHNALAIEVHAANFPDADHVRADLLDETASRYADPERLPPARLLVASPSCRHHSPANAKKVYAKGPGQLQLGDDGNDDRHLLSERSRVTAMCPLRYAAKHRPEAVIVENVVEFAHWGANRDGSTFRWWLNEWDLLGYETECVFLNSGFFPPCPQSRDRMYVVIWRRGNPRPDLDHRPDAYCTSDRCNGELVTAMQAWKPTKPTWPLARWGKHGPQYNYRCTDCNQVVTPISYSAATAIDWSDLGPTLGDRDRPLAPRTIDRIKRGLRKFRHYPLVVLADGQLVSMVIPNRINGRPYNPTGEAPPTVVAGANHLNLASVVLPAAGNTYERPGQTRARHTAQQLFSQTGTLEHGIASMPFFVEMRGGGSITAGQHPVTGPMHTVTAGGMHHGLAIAGFTKVNGGPNDTAWHPPIDQLGAVTARDTTGLLSATLPLTHANSSDRARHAIEPFATLTTARERYLINAPGDVDLDDVHFRMLRPDPELRRAMAFDDDYILLGNKTQMTAGLGNAVTPPVATWLTGRVLATLDTQAVAA